MDRPVDRFGETLARWTTEELTALAAEDWTLIGGASIADELAWRTAQE